jgi:hypothetical protein
VLSCFVLHDHFTDIFLKKIIPGSELYDFQCRILKARYTCTAVMYLNIGEVILCQILTFCSIDIEVYTLTGDEQTLKMSNGNCNFFYSCYYKLVI